MRNISKPKICALCNEPVKINVPFSAYLGWISPPNGQHMSTGFAIHRRKAAIRYRGFPLRLTQGTPNQCPQTGLDIPIIPEQVPMIIQRPELHKTLIM